MMLALKRIYSVQKLCAVDVNGVINTFIALLRALLIDSICSLRLVQTLHYQERLPDLNREFRGV